MVKSNCIKDKCKFYDALSECAVDGCLFGASIEDNEKERGCFMNGFTVLADSYKKLAAEGKITQEDANAEIRVYEFLGGCSQDDFYRLFDSSAFNDIMKAYFKAALKNAALSDEQIDSVMDELRLLLDAKQSKEICED